MIFSSKCACISSTILTFLQNNPVCFYTKNSLKVNFPQIANIMQGNLLTFLPKKLFFSSKCACISSTILTFLQNNPVWFYTKNSQKVNFSSNCGYNTGHFIDFSPKKVIFSSKCERISNTLLTLFPNNPVFFTTKIQKKLIFPQISIIIQGTLLTFLSKKIEFFLKMRVQIEHYFDFFAQ